MKFALNYGGSHERRRLVSSLALPGMGMGTGTGVGVYDEFVIGRTSVPASRSSSDPHCELCV